jgi:signal transduction histidine kinase
VGALQRVVPPARPDRVGFQFTSDSRSVLAGAVQTLSSSLLYPQMQSFVLLGRFAEQKTAADVVTSVEAQRNRSLIELYLTAALGVVVVGAVAIGGLVIARSIALPLGRLTSSTLQVARQAEQELVRVADDESETAEPIVFDPVRVTTDDEIGDLARAFERISRTAVLLVGRQVTGRRNVAQMFGHVGRRTQNLVSRQITLIDSLGQRETDAHRLGDLYRLDHLTSRLRRNANSLVTLSGAPDQGAHFAPLPLGDVIRLALAEIEGYARVDIVAPVDLMIMPGAVNDVVLLIAELMENSTSFSPPHTRVTVTVQARPARITITDHGLGLSPERLQEENARLAERERLDLVPTEVLGLFVVGRLARRHGLRVVLTDTPGGGVTVSVDVAEIVLAGMPANTTVVARATVAAASRAGIGVHNRPDTQIRIPDADGLIDLEHLHRATRAIESGQPWKAFALTEPAPPDDQPEPSIGPSGLIRRVPGATIKPDKLATKPPAARPQSPDEVLDLVQQFESGVARAMSEFQPAQTEEEATR